MPGMTDPGGDALPDLRASDAEREEAAEVLRVAASEGRLDVDELDDRLGSVYSVRTRNELERLIADVSPERLGQVRAIVPPGKSTSGLTIKEGPGGSRWVRVRDRPENLQRPRSGKAGGASQIQARSPKGRKAIFVHRIHVLIQGLHPPARLVVSGKPLTSPSAKRRSTV